MNIEKLKAKLEKSFNDYVNDKNNKIKWYTWKRLIDLEETKQVYKDLFGVDYTYQSRSRLHLFKNWIIPGNIHNEDIITAWIAHDVKRDVNGLQIDLYDNWQSKVKKTQQKAILKLCINKE